MRRAILLTAVFAGLAGCATHGAKSEVNAVVNDEKARAAAAADAQRSADSKEALKAGAEAASQQPIAPR